MNGINKGFAVSTTIIDVSKMEFSAKSSSFHCHCNSGNMGMENSELGMAEAKESGETAKKARF